MGHFNQFKFSRLILSVTNLNLFCEIRKNTFFFKSCHHFGKTVLLVGLLNFQQKSDRYRICSLQKIKISHKRAEVKKKALFYYAKKNV